MTVLKDGNAIVKKKKHFLCGPPEGFSITAFVTSKYEIVPKVNNQRELQLLQTWLEICVCVCVQKEERHPSEGEGLRAAAEFLAFANPSTLP